MEHNGGCALQFGFRSVHGLSYSRRGSCGALEHLDFLHFGAYHVESFAEHGFKFAPKFPRFEVDVWYFQFDRRRSAASVAEPEFCARYLPRFSGVACEWALPAWAGFLPWFCDRFQGSVCLDPQVFQLAVFGDFLFSDYDLLACHKSVVL